MGSFSFGKGKRIVDLSLTLKEGAPSTWPGMKKFKHGEFKNFPSEADTCRTCWFLMDEHCGTHCDAPGHFVKPDATHTQDSLSGEHLDLRSLQGNLDVVDVRNLVGNAINGERPFIEPEVISKWETPGRNAMRNGVFRRAFISRYVTGIWKFFVFLPLKLCNSSGCP